MNLRAPVSWNSVSSAPIALSLFPTASVLSGFWHAYRVQRGRNRITSPPGLTRVEIHLRSS
jgi:hypothetical protein